MLIIMIIIFLVISRPPPVEPVPMRFEGESEHYRTVSKPSTDRI